MWCEYEGISKGKPFVISLNGIRFVAVRLVPFLVVARRITIAVASLSGTSNAEFNGFGFRLLLRLGHWQSDKLSSGPFEPVATVVARFYIDLQQNGIGDETGNL